MNTYKSLRHLTLLAVPALAACSTMEQVDPPMLEVDGGNTEKDPHEEHHNGTILECQAAAPCNSIEQVFTEYFELDAYDADMVCVLEALRDGTAGRYDAGEDMGDDAWTQAVFVTQGGDVLTQGEEYAQPYSFEGSPQRCQLRDAAFFTACLDTFDSDCLDPANWLEGCQDVIAGCGDV